MFETSIGVLRTSSVDYYILLGLTFVLAMFWKVSSDSSPLSIIETVWAPSKSETKETIIETEMQKLGKKVHFIKCTQKILK